MEKYYFFDSNELIGDERWYSAADWSKVLSKFLENGIYVEGDNLTTTAAGNAMAVTVGTGVAFIDGHMYENDSALSLKVDAAEATLDRVDLVVLRLDLTEQNRYIKAFVVKGEAAAAPIAPVPADSTFIKEIPLAEILVTAGKSILELTQITDKRPDDFVDPFMDGSRITKLETVLANVLQNDKGTYNKTEIDLLDDQSEANVMNWVKSLGLGSAVADASDWNTIATTGLYRSNVNGPMTNTMMYGIHLYSSDGYQLQFAGRNGRIFTRSKEAGTWGGWIELQNLPKTFVDVGRYASSQTISNNVNSRILFDVENVDKDNEFASNRFTPKSAGLYEFKIRGSMDNVSPEISLYTNGTKKAIIINQDLDNKSYPRAFAGSIFRELTAGEYCDFYAYQFSGFNYSLIEFQLQIIKVR
jgi:hypothetical protein